MATVAVLGGGISGLSCAYYLKTLGQSQIKYIFLLDKSPKFGGWIQSTRFPDGAVCEHGPRTIRCGTKPGNNALLLAEKLALTSRILPISKEHPASTANYIYANNKLNPLRGNFLSLIQKMPPLSKSPVSYIFKEMKTVKDSRDDESVYSFMERRVGEDVAKYIFDPLCRGITAGDARELSVRSMFPNFYEAEAKHGSIIRGLMKDGRTPMSSEFMLSDLVKKAKSELWRSWSLKSGLGEIIDALACTIEEQGITDLIFNAKCSSLTFRDGKAQVAVENENITVDHIFSAIPSYELAPLMNSYSVLSENLNSIPSVDLSVVYLEYEKDVLGRTGFGFLTPSFEDSKVLGVAFDSCCFPELNGKSKTRLSCMIGGRWFREMFGDPENVSEDALLKIATDEVSKHLNIMDTPSRHKVMINRKCIPQYVVGHHIKLEKIDEEIQKNHLCLSLVGASYKGAGVPDCIYNSKLSVESYLKSL